MEFTYTNHYKRIEAEFNEKICFWFIGDIHRDTPQCDKERWDDCLKKIKESFNEFKQVYIFGMGDYHDFVSFSEQAKIRASNLHDTTIARLDLDVQERNRKFANECSFMRDHFLGLIEGNHSWTFKEGKTSTEDLAERLGTVCLGWLSYFRLSIKLNKLNKYAKIDFCLCHGKAGGKTAGVTFNQVDEMRKVFPVADVYCFGHDHQRGVLPQSILVATDGNFTIKQKRQFLCRSGSFKRAYMENTSGYEIGRLLKPSDLGALQLIVYIRREKRNKQDFCITEIEGRV